nr:butyrophilin subfamily 3 member A2-like [Pelodiscus sinensis]|eukprot:XP_025040856.1 butyrophilin subfamily 3 member A2-like [Pelodiscus sinensis]
MKVPSICQSARASSPLPGFLVFFLTCHVGSRESAQFTVVGPDQPVTAVVGDDVVLPCHLCPRMSAENMEVRWFQRESIPFVHLYRYGKDKFGQQMSKYRGRTELSKAGITDGNVALRIVNVRPSDEGQYHCFVQDGASYEETVLELKVAASGSAPHISVEDYQDGGIRVVCRSAGWYPEPEVVWRDLNGQAFPSASQTNSQEANGLYGTQTSAIVMENSNRNLSCLVRNTRLSQEKESTLFYISDPLFPKVNPWKVSLDMMILVVLFGFIALSVYLFKIKGKCWSRKHRDIHTGFSSKKEEIKPFCLCGMHQSLRHSNHSRASVKTLPVTCWRGESAGALAHSYPSCAGTEWYRAFRISPAQHRSISQNQRILEH